jgi:putative ABC transport system permease protein
VFETIWQDVRYGVRVLRRSPLFSLTAALSLAIGIGANVTIFSVATALLIRPLPGIADRAGLVDVGRTSNGRGFDTVSYPNYTDLRERATTLSGVYAWRVEPEPMSLTRDGGAERVYGTRVSGNYFSVIGVRAQVGRLFTDADDQPGHDDVTVIGDALWRQRFGADPAIVGSTITITGRAVTVVGVAPRGFQGTTILSSDLWLPLSTERTGGGDPGMFTNRRITWLVMGGRLKPGVTLAQANSEIASIGQSLAREYPQENAERSLRIAPSSIFPGRVNVIGGFVGVLMAIVGLILLVACVNLAGMLLSRAVARRREMAVRMAIGAGRSRLVRQLLTETTLLFAAGCAAGLIVGRWFIALLLALLPQLPVPIGIDVAIDWRVTLFAIGLSIVTGVLSGLAPALQVSGLVLVPSLKADASEGGPARLRLRNAFLVGQIALSLLLVVCGALFVRALQQAGRMDPGFDQANVETVSFNLALAGLGDAEAIAFVHDLESRLRALPNVSAVVTASDLPLDGDRMSFGDVRAAGAPRDDARNGPPVDWNLVTPGVFSTLRITLLRGRDFTDHDTAASEPVVIVNAALGRRLWGDGDPIGRKVSIDTPFGSGSRQATVVGVAADAQFAALGERTPYLYAPLAQQYHPRVSLVIRTTGTTVIPSVRAIAHQMKANLPVVEAMPLSDITAIGLVPQRIAAAVAGTLGVVGLLLAAMGIYGVTSYAAGQRTREIGIRMALGADRSKVLQLVVRQGLLLTAIGVGLGVLASAAGAQVLRSLLLGVSALDPIAFGAAAALFFLVALAASLGPAVRAARVDPMTALRAE